MARALSPLGETLGRILAEKAKGQTFKAYADTARPEVAQRLGTSWRLYDASPETHLANAESDIEPEDIVWALQQAIREAMAAEDFEIPIPTSERQNSLLDTVLGRALSFAPRLGIDIGDLPSDEEINERQIASTVDELRDGGRGFSLGPLDEITERVVDYGGRAAGLVNDARHAVAGTAPFQDVVEPTVQGAVMVFDTPYQMTQASFRTALRRYREGGLVGDRGIIPTSPSGALGMVGQQALDLGFQTELTTAAGVAGAGLIGADAPDLDFGDGYFVGGSVREIAESQRAAQGTINGQGITIGRWLASPLEAGSLEHRLLSGFTDAAIAVAGPGELAIARSLEAGAAARSLRSTDAVAPAADNVAQRLFRDWGGLRRTRPTYDAQRVRYALDTDLGQRTLDRIGESDAYDIRRLFKGKIPAPVAHALAQADATEARQILQRELGASILTRPRGQLSRGVGSLMEVGREASLGRTAARALDVVPGRWMNIEDPTRALDNIDSELLNLRASESTRRRWTNRFAATETRFEREQLLREFDIETGLRIALGQNPSVRGGVVRRAVHRAGPVGKPLDDVALGAQIDEWAAAAGFDSDELFARILSGNKAPTGVASIDNRVNGLLGRVRSFTGRWTDNIRQGREYTQASIARGEVNGGLMSSGEHIDAVNEPFLWDELVGKNVPRPDHRALRRMFSSHPGLFYNNHDLRVSSKVYDGLARFESGVFKPAVLIRLAWTLRVIGEEQLRMAAAHHSNALNRPIRHIALSMGRGGKAGTFKGDALGATFASMDIHGTAMARGSQGYGAGRHATIENWDVVDTGQLRASDQLDRAVDAWSERVAMLGHDPIVQFVVRHDGSFDELSEAFWVQMRQSREDIMVSHPNGGPRRSNGTQLDLRTREGSDAYLQEINKIIDEITGGDLDIREALRTHQLDGHTLATDPSTAAISGRFKRALAARQDRMPAFLPEMTETARSGAGGLAAAWENGTEYMMGWLMSKPTNQLSRSPVFREEYWNEIEALAPRISQEELGRLLKNAQSADISAERIRALRSRVGQASGDVRNTDIGSLSLAEADMLAKGQALDHVQDLLFDLTKRNQFFDAQRLIFPFGDAWAEVVTRWAKLVRNNPQVIRRGEQVIQAGRDQGWFYEDPTSGDEVFMYPGSDWINRGWAGVDVPFKGRLKGLSLATEILPGIGPTTQMALSGYFPDGADWDWARDIVFPYGQPDSDDHIINRFYDSFAPTGPARVLSSRHPFTGAEMRELATASSRSFDYLISTGDYDINNPDPDIASAEFQRAFEDGRRAGQTMVLIRGLGNLVLPTAPSPDWNIETLSGEQVSMAFVRELSDKFYEIDPENASNLLIRTLGVPALFSSNGRSVDLLPGRGWPPTAEAEEWARANGGIIDDFPLVAQIFAPQSGEFDPAAFSRLRRLGFREDLEYEAVVSDGMHGLGLLMYYEERDRVTELAGGERELNAGHRRYLAEYDKWLMETLSFEGGGYAGRFNDPVGVPAEAPADVARVQLERAVNDERLADTDISVAVRAYLEAEEGVTERFRASGAEAAGWETSVAGRPYRTYLAELAAHLSSQTPDFTGVYESILRDRMVQGLRDDDRALEEAEDE